METQRKITVKSSVDDHSIIDVFLDEEHIARIGAISPDGFRVIVPAHPGDPVTEWVPAPEQVGYFERLGVEPLDVLDATEPWINMWESKEWQDEMSGNVADFSLDVLPLGDGQAVVHPTKKRYSH